MRPAGATRNHPTTMATRPDAMHPRNQPQRMWKPGGRVSEAVTSAGSVATIPASVRYSRASNAGIHLLLHREFTESGVDPGEPLADHVARLGDRRARGIEPTSTLDPYSAGPRKRILPRLGI